MSGSDKNTMIGKRGFNKDLTSGKTWKAIVLFALPLLGSSLVQQLYSTVDLLFVSRLIGTEAASAVGSSDLLVTCIIGLFTGISIGSNVIAAQAFGSRDRKQLHSLIQTVVTFGMIGAAVLLVIGEILTPVLLALLNTPVSIRALAVTYLRIYFLCIFSIVLYNLSSGIVRALGDSAAAMRFQIYGGVANIFADFLMIAVFKWGVAGAAFATFLSQTTAAGFTLHYLAKLDDDIRLKIREPQINGKILKRVLGIGVPSGIQSMIMTFSNLIVQSVINGFGVTIIAAFVVYFKVELFIWYPIVSIGQALVTFTAQNVGAGKRDRVKSGVATGIGMGIGLSLVLGFGLLALAKPIFGIFNTDPDVIAAGVQIASVTFPFYFLYVLSDGFGSVLKGFGEGLSPMVITISCICILRLILLFAFTAVWDSVRVVAAVYPLSWAAAGILMFIRCIPFLKNKRAKA